MPKDDTELELGDLDEFERELETFKVGADIFFLFDNDMILIILIAEDGGCDDGQWE